jgi:hypothetical protein
MRTNQRIGFILSIAGLLATGAAFTVAADKDQESLNPKLEALRPFIGKTFRGEMKDSTPEKPQVDVVRFERALNGQAVRSLHSINNGAYGGETLIFWDKTKQQIIYYYFTTAGFYTTGSMTLTNNKYTSFEKVAGEAGGVSEVKGSGEIRPDGTMITSSEYLKEGKWVPGHGATYKQDPKAEVKFK